MSVIGGDEFDDAAGNKHNWKKELTAKPASLQQPEGSWTIPADRWYEGDPNLVTAVNRPFSSLRFDNAVMKASVTSPSRSQSPLFVLSRKFTVNPPVAPKPGTAGGS